ncbi:putative thiamine-phosphate synthase [Geotalea uraniireducens]|uniref:Thiamine-phosphate synthase n=1 Tax=Geotalea uraniireducens TaxID=351604 RepID=A0ABM8EH42_9BACT|nr:thiamine phosphate synthase [Geotalea uraniireducens]BDV41717.1 putative thiamine-phosphate synthase [Geotalea uraniireducens]
MARVGFSLYLITDRRQTNSRPLDEVIEAALRGGVKAVQLREKDLSPREQLELAHRLRELTSRYGARLLVNDRLDIALAVEADGVHLGEAGIDPATARRLIGPERLIGVSCHSVAGALAAQQGGADFITFGPVFATPSKARYGEPVGVKPLSEAKRQLRIPIFALGGICRNSVPEVLAAGADGIAMISAIIAADNPREEAAAFLDLLPSPAGNE